MALTRTDLEAAIVAGCEYPLCDHKDETIYLHGRCHPQAHVEVSFTKGSGVIRIACAICKKPISEIKVADA